MCPGAEPYPEISRPWAHQIAHGLFVLEEGQDMNIVLIGYRSVGKTSLGRLLAKELGMDFLDTDLLVEEIAGEGISSFVAKNGWEAFRILESSVLRTLIGLDGYVISTGGGCLNIVENLSLIRSLGHIIWVKAPASEILERMSQLFRPLFSSLDPKREIQIMLRKSSPLYLQVADIVLDIGYLAPTEATKILKLAIQERFRF